MHVVFCEEDFRPHMTFWQLSGAVAAMAVELADIHDAMAEVNWVGLQNHLKKESGNRARHLQFIAVEFNKDFFNFNVVSKILCSLPLRWWKVKGDLLDTFYDKVFTIISKCRQETYSVLLIPLLKDHKRRVKEASASNKYNFLVRFFNQLLLGRTVKKGFVF
ncbi:unnamed protein product [Nippostrongylus brasiliensis]|uniref:GLOBIN domain-containing protein n=1 Tax=Nippostrongylus brasiliensis TaxID=27835 RepID=A0A0N4Y1N0_NIPBR|nr:unnamed protein product [Nippostrongylus brasiliensis]